MCTLRIKTNAAAIAESERPQKYCETDELKKDNFIIKVTKFFKILIVEIIEETYASSICPDKIFLVLDKTKIVQDKNFVQG